MSWARDSIGPPLRQPHCRLVTAQVHAKLISLAAKTRYVTAHVCCPALPATLQARASSKVRRLAAWLVASASDRKAGPWLVTGFALAHAVLWTLILINLKAAQDVHMDVAEAYAWGQKFQLGYGKHPPLSGWIAGLWFMLFPVANWSTYALAMATLGTGLVICWLIALRVVDRRRAFFMVVMLALYPIFNFKGYKYNPDLLQLVTLPMVVLAYLHAFERRTVRAGVWLGLAGALALMTKYWVLTMIGAVGIAALIHPDRLKFLRSPAPWVAIATLVVAMIPHLIWLKDVDFAPLTYAGDVYALTSRTQCLQLVIGYIGHNLALLVVPVLLAATALAWTTDDAGQACLAARRRYRREPVTGAEHLDHPDRGRGWASARCPRFHRLSQDRLGNLAVLSDPAGAGCNSVAAPSRHCVVPYCRDLARDHAGRAGRIALHRGARDGRQSERCFGLRRALRTRPRTDAGLA